MLTAMQQKVVAELKDCDCFREWEGVRKAYRLGRQEFRKLCRVALDEAEYEALTEAELAARESKTVGEFVERAYGLGIRYEVLIGSERWDRVYAAGLKQIREACG